MRVDYFLSKLKLFWRIFIAPPKNWILPKKSEVLIYDASGADALAPYLTAYNVAIMSVRGESVNVPCILRALFKQAFWKGKPLAAYAEAFIQAVSPQLVITFIDNNPAFYSISRRFQVVTIFLQNGNRLGSNGLFSQLKKMDSCHVDYMLVFGAAIGRKYQEYISGSVQSVGSLKNNAVKKTAGKMSQSVLFISQYRSENHAQFYSADVIILKFLSKWCMENKMKLQICGVSLEEVSPESEFYAGILAGSEWEYLPRADHYSSYRSVDAAQIVVFIESTLGCESIARGKKTACFSCRGEALNRIGRNFGWPADLPNNGPFWTNHQDERQFQRVMDYLNIVSDEEWEQTRQRYASELMEFDPGNTRFIALLDQLLPRTENRLK